MVVMASLSHGLEQVLGRGATTITFRAGRNIGLKSEIATSEPDMVKALALLDNQMQAKGIHWPFEVWKHAADSSLIYEKEGKKALKLVFHNCMVRCALFRYSHDQRLSLCMMNHGLFCGFLQKITGKKADLEIIHAGENACLKELTWTE
jgi:predicted hydrocarbon binding protein